MFKYVDCIALRVHNLIASTTLLQKVEGKRLHSASNPLSNLPQVVGSVRDVQRVLEFVNGSLLCQGNDDKDIISAVTHRKGVIMDVTGRYDCSTRMLLVLQVHYTFIFIYMYLPLFVQLNVHKYDTCIYFSPKELCVWPVWTRRQFDPVTVTSLFPQPKPHQLVQCDVLDVSSTDQLCEL